MNTHAVNPRHQRRRGLPRRRFTVAEVEAMVAAGVMEEDERVELIGGELVPMSPKGLRHEIVKVALLEQWYRAAPAACDLVRRLAVADAFVVADRRAFTRASGLPASRQRWSVENPI